MGYGAFRKARRKQAAAQIGLNPEAKIAVALMFEMAYTLGQAKPEHFVFCARENRNFDDTRPPKFAAHS